MAVTFDPILGKLRTRDTVTLSEVNVDPSNPQPGDTWVLRSGGGDVVAGNPIGLLLTLTYAEASGTPASYELSFRTAAGTTVRAALA